VVESGGEAQIARGQATAGGERHLPASNARIT
jgi:hypothetical protein